MGRGSTRGKQVTWEVAYKEAGPSYKGISDAKLHAAHSDPDVAVKLSARIPELLELAADTSKKCLTQFSGTSSSSGGAGSSVSDAARQADQIVRWENNVRWSYLAVTALVNTSRLPAQQVLDHFASPAAGEGRSCL
jgi:hypothetical protein